jgi:aspartate carbamoyltransferase regulatory subunit
MIVDSIEKGIVIDHISAGLGLSILDHLDVDKTNTIAYIMNAASKKYGRKDLVKIENVVDVDLAVLGLLDPNATVNVIENGIIIEKINLKLPEKVVNVLKCKNPRCVTSIEVNAPQIFHLADEEQRVYRCEYCDDLLSVKEES